MPTPKPTDRHDNLRPLSGIEIQIAKHIVATKEAELLEEGTPTQKTDVPAVDLPNVVAQMRKERAPYTSYGSTRRCLQMHRGPQPYVSALQS